MLARSNWTDRSARSYIVYNIIVLGSSVIITFAARSKEHYLLSEQRSVAVDLFHCNNTDNMSDSHRDERKKIVNVYYCLYYFWAIPIIILLYNVSRHCGDIVLLFLVRKIWFTVIINEKFCHGSKTTPLRSDTIINRVRWNY